MPTHAEDLLAACKAQHEAIDILFAMLIWATKDSQKPFYPSESGKPWAALNAGNAAIKAAEEADTTYTYEHLEAGACMWEHVLDRIRRHKGGLNPWLEYREAYGIAQLRGVVLTHAPQLEAKYLEAVANGYGDAFDWDFVPKYMEDHVTRILT